MCSGRAEAAGPRWQHEIKAAKGVSPLRACPGCPRASAALGARSLPARAPGSVPRKRLPGPGTGLLKPPPHRVQSEEDPKAGGDEQEHPEEPAPREVHANPAGVRPVRHPCALSSPGGRAEWRDLEGRAEAVALLCPAQPTAGCRGASGSCSSPCVLAGPEVATTPETEPESPPTPYPQIPPKKGRRAATEGQSLHLPPIRAPTPLTSMAVTPDAALLQEPHPGPHLAQIWNG